MNKRDPQNPGQSPETSAESTPEGFSPRDLRRYSRYSRNGRYGAGTRNERNADPQPPAAPSVPSPSGVDQAAGMGTANANGGQVPAAAAMPARSAPTVGVAASAGNAGIPGATPVSPTPAAGTVSPFGQTQSYLKESQKRRRRKRRRIIGVVVACVLALIACGAGFAFAYINNIQSNLGQNVDQEVLAALDSNATAAGDPFYMLLMGTDGSQERENSEEYAGDNFRTDSMMLLRVDPQQKKVACVSLVRDTKMDFGEYGIQKLNAAHAVGGTKFTIKTVSDLAGVPISHYAIINFDGFKEVVNALGGIEVDVPVEIDDDEAGGYLAQGLQTLNGDQALILCRSRHTYDDIGDGDGYRAANQRTVISAIAKKILASDLPTMMSTIEALSKYVETDLDVMEIVNLGNSMRGIDMDADFYTATMPTVSEYSDDTWWEILDKDEWRTMMKRIDAGQSPTEDDVIDEYTGMVIANAGTASQSQPVKGTRSGLVTIRNGCGLNGVANEAATLVGQLGYDTDPANANSSDYLQTIVVYDDPSQLEAAQEIVEKLGVGEAVLNDSQYLYSGDFLVVIGADWM